MSSHLNRRAALLAAAGGVFEPDSAAAQEPLFSAHAAARPQTQEAPHPQRMLQVVHRPQRTGLKLVVLPAVLRLR